MEWEIRAKRLANSIPEGMVFPVSTSDIKANIDRMTEDERFFAAAYLKHLAQENDSAFQTTLAERIKRIEEGHKVTLEQVQHIHKVLEAEGL